MRTIGENTVTAQHFDVVIVGAGISGAILAKQLGEAGKKVLVLEAGRATSTTPDGYASYVENFYMASAKVPNSPYTDNANAPAPNVLMFRHLEKKVPDSAGYFVQNGPLPFLSDYLRAKGGTTLHWLGNCPRMLPNDFELRSLYGHGVDWPIAYERMQPYYEMAEQEIGVSADAKDQAYLGITFRDGYDFPMHKLPQSYLDHHVANGIARLKVPLGKQEYEVQIVSTPQGRNSTPRGDYKPIGAVGDPGSGKRCEGNASCVPICPVQAKYSALKTLAKAQLTKNIEIRSQAVASKIEIDPHTRKVTGVTYQLYQDENSPGSTTYTVQGTVYVLAAHAVENAKLLLASGAANSSDQVGRNLMDHPTLLTWALMPKPIGSFRGPGCTSLIPTFRDGPFRKEHSAFIVPIDNWGWTWPAFSPYSDVAVLVDNQHAFGRKLRRALQDTLSRQFTLQFEFEQLPEAHNRVTIDDKYKDVLGNHRPIIHYNVPDYTRAAMAAAREISKEIFKRLGVKPGDDHTIYHETDPGYLTYENQGYTFWGAGHLVGTHRMGDDPKTSVVNPDQRAWDHDNLYLVGAGNMPTLGTSNPTLTLAALAFWAAENILKDLK